jgi:hypothetical protein
MSYSSAEYEDRLKWDDERGSVEGHDGPLEMIISEKREVQNRMLTMQDPHPLSIDHQVAYLQ